MNIIPSLARSLARGSNKPVRHIRSLSYITSNSSSANRSAVSATASAAAPTAHLNLTSFRLCSKTTTTESASATDGPSNAEAELQKIIAEKDTQIGDLTKEVADLKDKYMRSLAESENVRSRSQKLVSDSKLYGIQSFSKDLLEMADILDKAQESVPAEELANSEQLKLLFEGVTMTNTQLQKIFSKHGLVRLDPVGEKFDPHFHEALFMMPGSGQEPGNVAVCQKVGYRLHKRSLRPALVAVAQ